MSDIQEKLSQILENPEALKQIQNLGSQLGLTQNKSEKSQNNQPNSSPQGLLNDDTLKLVSKFAPLMQSVNKEDDTSRLLNALRPFLSDEKQEKVDKAEKMLKLLKIIPLLKENGLFNL